MDEKEDKGTEQILLEHQELLEAVAELETAAEAPPVAGAEHGGGRLRHLLGELTPKLQAHFAAETTTTSLERVAHDARLMAQLRELDAEHRTLLDAFQEAHRLAQASHEPSKRLRRLLADAVRAFREHEAKEDILFRELP